MSRADAILSHKGHEGLATKDTKNTKGSAMTFEAVPAAVEQVATEVIGAAIEVHKHLGPGFLERIYHEALSREFEIRRIAFERECAVVVNYKGMAISGQRIDLVVEQRLVVELKATTRVDPAHEAKVISYLRTMGLRLGLLLNFNGRTMKEGIKRIVV
jgi:GxxExxY protein